MMSNDTVCGKLDIFTGMFAATHIMVHDLKWQAENRNDWSSSMKQIQDKLNEQRSISKDIFWAQSPAGVSPNCTVMTKNRRNRLIRMSRRLEER
jgi:hypothetical protein